MDAWGDIRLKARACHGLALKAAKGDRTGAALLDAALKSNDLEISFYDEGDKAGPGVLGFLERSSLMVNIARGQNADDQLVVAAHEFGHFNPARFLRLRLRAAPLPPGALPRGV